MFKNLYHVSNPINRNSILKKGLIPSVGISQFLQWKISRKRIFLSEKNDYDSTYDDDRFLIKLPKHLFKHLKIDKEVKCSKCYYLDNKRVPRKYLKLIYKGSGESTF